MPPPTACENSDSAGRVVVRRRAGRAKRRRDGSARRPCGRSGCRRRTAPARWRTARPDRDRRTSCSASASTASGSTAPAAEMTSRDGRYSCASQSRQSSRVRARIASSRPSTGRASGWLPERGLEQMVVDQIVGRIAAFAKLGQDDLLLALQLGLVDRRARGPDRRSARAPGRHRRAGCGRGTRSGRARSRR